MLYHAVPFFPMVIGQALVHSGIYHAVPSYPMVHEDRINSEINMLRVWYTVGCTVLYHSALFCP